MTVVELLNRRKQQKYDQLKLLLAGNKQTTPTEQIQQTTSQPQQDQFTKNDQIASIQSQIITSLPRQVKQTVIQTYSDEQLNVQQKQQIKVVQSKLMSNQDYPRKLDQNSIQARIEQLEQQSNKLDILLKQKQQSKKLALKNNVQLNMDDDYDKFLQLYKQEEKNNINDGDFKVQRVVLNKVKTNIKEHIQEIPNSEVIDIHQQEELEKEQELQKVLIIDTTQQGNFDSYIDNEDSEQLQPIIENRAVKKNINKLPNNKKHQDVAEKYEDEKIHILQVTKKGNLQLTKNNNTKQIRQQTTEPVDQDPQIEDTYQRPSRKRIVAERVQRIDQNAQQNIKIKYQKASNIELSSADSSYLKISYSNEE